MLLIESVKVREVPGDEVRVYTGRPDVGAYADYAQLSIEERARKTEFVQGRVFRTAEGKEFVIGMTREVSEVIGLPYDAYSNMSAHMEELREELALVRSVNFRLTHRLKTIRGMSFWERMSRVFVGFYTLSTK